MHELIMSVVRKTIHLGNFLSPPRFGLCQDRNAFRPGIFITYIRNYTASTDDGTKACEKMQQILQKRFPKAKKIEVNDLSGGCGSMYEIFVETVEFKGLTLVKQHMLINQTLKDQIKNMHGLTVKTKVAEVDGS